MRRAHAVVPAADVAPGDVTCHLRLDLEGRRRRRHVVATLDGGEVLIDLAEPPALKHGDGLRLEEGGIALVEAEPEAITEVRAADADLRLRLAWHLGNRHLPVQFAGDTLLIRRDHVIEAMLMRLGAELRHLEAPFQPEPGAYDHRHGGGEAS